MEFLQYSFKRANLLPKCGAAGTSFELDGSLKGIALSVDFYHCSTLTSNDRVINWGVSWASHRLQAPGSGQPGCTMPMERSHPADCFPGCYFSEANNFHFMLMQIWSSVSGWRQQERKRNWLNGPMNLIRGRICPLHFIRVLKPVLCFPSKWSKNASVDSY